jgi:hypothetical protein
VVRATHIYSLIASGSIVALFYVQVHYLLNFFVLHFFGHSIFNMLNGSTLGLNAYDTACQICNHFPSLSSIAAMLARFSGLIGSLTLRAVFAK